MRISDVLKGKGDSTVATIRPDASVSDLLALLANRKIGAVVVSEDGTTTVSYTHLTLPTNREV